ncbi:MAG: hypothetical protein ACYCSS_04665 [Sulfuriferula sp.]
MLLQSENIDYELIYDRLLRQFEGRQVISLYECARILKYQKSTAQSMVSRNIFPIPAFRIGGRNMVRLLDLAKYLATSPSLTPTPPRRRGRPRKGTGPKFLDMQRAIRAREQAEQEQAEMRAAK